MEGNVSRVVRFAAGFVALLTLGWILTGHAAKPLPEGLPNDWTHQHVIFSQPETMEEVARLAGDPRYWQQFYRQNVARVVAAGGDDFSGLTPAQDEQIAGSHRSNDWVQTLGAGGTVGAGNFPGKYSFNINVANCASTAPPDFVVFSTGLVGSGTQASIVAFDNLYSGCTGTVPSVYWAYNTGGEILTSPIFSRNGSQIAFVQTTNRVGGVASLVLLKWAASLPGTESVGSPQTLTTVSPASLYPNCTAPCMVALPLETGGGTPTATNDTTSSVFYDYVGDTAWIGDASSWLHQFTPVFNGTTSTPPGEYRSSSWPVHVNAATPTALTSAVHDPISGNVYVEDQGGFLYEVNASSGNVTESARVDFGVGPVDGPILDRTAQKLYVYSSSDGTTNCAGAPCSAIFQFNTNFGKSATGTETAVGTSSAAPNPLYAGAFDNAFYSSSVRTGNLYVCGDTGVNPMLFRVPITAGVLGAATEVVPITTAANHRACSPVTDVPNPNGAVGPQERTYFSVVNSGVPTACAGGGCAISFVSMPWTATTVFQVGQEILVYRPGNNTHYVNVAIQAGTSGKTAPTWPAGIAAITVDGGVQWLNQGAVVNLDAFAAWAAHHAYAVHNRILDSNGNIEVVTAVGTSGGTSGAAAPTWNTTAGGTTLDGTAPTQITWTNAGALPSSALAAAGGTSGIIIDNTVSQAKQPGASQRYFSTLANQNCPTTSTGCAVQTSQ